MPRFEITIATPYYTVFEVYADNSEDAHEAWVEDAAVEIDSYPGNDLEARVVSVEEA